MKKEIVPVEKRKNQVVAGLFSIFLWPLGLHCFYLRELVGGILNVSLFLFFNFLMILLQSHYLETIPFVDRYYAIAYCVFALVVLGVVSTIYGIRILFMTGYEFNQTYNQK